MSLHGPRWNDSVALPLKKAMLSIVLQFPLIKVTCLVLGSICMYNLQF